MAVLLDRLTNYEPFIAEFTLTDADALRVALICQHPVVKMGNLTCFVTFHHEGLTDGNCNENLEEARRELQRDFLQLELPEA